MSTDLGTRYDQSFARTPPHISPEDLNIWLRYWPLLRPKIREIYFDVGLGDGNTAPPGAPPQYAKMWKRLGQKRADVVALVGTEVWIIELRNAASANAIGRLWTYWDLYLDDPVLGKNVKLVLVTDERDKDVERVAARAGITYLVV